MPPSPIAPEKMTALPAVVAPTLVVRLYVTPVPESVTGPENVRICSPVAVGKVVFAEIVTVLARVTAPPVVARICPPASVKMPVPKGPLVTVPLVGVELTVGTLTEPADNVVPPE